MDSIQLWTINSESVAYCGPNSGCPKNNGTVNFQDFALINSYLCSPCWIEHLFLFIITPRSFNLVKKFLFSYGLSFSGFAIKFSLVGGPQNMD